MRGIYGFSPRKAEVGTVERRMKVTNTEGAPLSASVHTRKKYSHPVREVGVDSHLTDDLTDLTEEPQWE